METTPFDAVPDQFPPVTNQEMKNQCDSGVRPEKNAIDLRPNPEKKNADYFVVKLIPIDSWWKFDDAFKEQTNDHVHHILEQVEIADKLGKGDFRLMLSIHKMPCCHQEAGEYVTALERNLNKILEFYLEELDSRLFAEKIGEKVLEFRSRKENLEFLLKRLFGSEGTNARSLTEDFLADTSTLGVCVVFKDWEDNCFEWMGFKTLQEFCAKGYTYIQNGIKAMTGNRAEDESLFGQELFTANVKLSIGMIAASLKPLDIFGLEERNRVGISNLNWSTIPEQSSRVLETLQWFDILLSTPSGNGTRSFAFPVPVQQLKIAACHTIREMSKRKTWQSDL